MRAGAAAAFDEARRLNQKKADVQASTFAVGVGRARAASGDVSGAIEQFERAVALAPENFEAHYELAKAFTARRPAGRGADAPARSAPSCPAPPVPGSVMRTRVLCILAGIAAIASPQAPAPLGFSFADVAREAGLTAPTVYGGQTHQQIPARDDRLRRGHARLRQRRLARSVLRQRHDAGRISARQGTDEPPVSQPRQRHIRRCDGARRPGDRRVGAGRVRRRLRQ